MNRQISFLLAASVALISPTMSLAAPAARPISVAKLTEIPATVVSSGTIMHVSFDTDISSAKAAVGDQFPIHVIDDVVVNGYVVIKAGALGAGTIIAVSPASKATAGTISYDIAYVKTVDDKKLRLTSNVQSAQAQRQTQPDTNALVAVASAVGSRAISQAVATGAVSSVAGSTVLGALGPLGMAAGFVPGLFSKKKKEATITTGAVVIAYVLGTVHVASDIKASANAVPAPIASDDGYAR